ncbi:MAG: hypothetical protein MJZ89_04005 [Paludibacteraceae bacterium]|nr:hypothetical protein [Paludibacteraceae bacterium]
MKRLTPLFLPVLVAATLTCCGPIPEGPTDGYKDQQLIGRWKAPSQAAEAKDGDSIVFVFQAESCQRPSGNYGRWGYSYDEGEDVHESDLLNQEEDGDYHGNGWFGWQIDGTDIQSYQMFTISSERVSPYRYSITKLTSDSLVLKEGKHTHRLVKRAL